MDPRMRCGNEAFEKRVRHVWFALELRMKLARDEKRMLRQLNNFYQLPIWSEAAK